MYPLILSAESKQPRGAKGILGVDKGFVQPSVSSFGLVKKSAKTSLFGLVKKSAKTSLSGLVKVPKKSLSISNNKISRDKIEIVDNSPTEQTLETTTTITTTSTYEKSETTTLPVQLLEDFYASSEEFPKDLNYSIEGRNFGLSINDVIMSCHPIFEILFPLPPPPCR